MPTTAARPRRTPALAALLLLVVAAAFAFGSAASARRPTVARSAPAVGFGFRDDVPVVAAVPARGADWVVGQQRGPQGDDQLVAVLLAVSVLLVAHLRRRASLSTRWGRAARRGHRTGIRGPPAFA
jgi:hypothetical protein